jgi:tetratricopeptide (TPR) repeat protein
VKWARRRPAAAAVIALSALLLGLVGGLLYAVEYQRQRAEQQRDKLGRLDSSRLKIRSEIVQGRRQVAGGNWNEAREALARAQTALDSEPELAAELKADVDDLAQRKEARRRAVEKREKFLALRDDALLHSTLAVGEDLRANLHATAQKSRAALDQFAVGPANGALPVLDDPALTPDEKGEVREDCYLLLLVLAEAVAQQKDDPRAADEAIRILRQAERLGIPTRAWHQRMARYLRQRGQDGFKAEEQLAEQFPPTLALDYYLLGDDHYKAGELKEAARDFDNVLALAPKNFLARYVLAVCYVRLDQPAEAQGILTFCTSQRPDFVWLYVLRGYAYGLLKDFPAAEKDFQQAERLLATQPDKEAQYALYANRGVLRARENKMDQAIADLNQAIGLRPRRYQAYLTLAEIYQERKEWGPALHSFNEAIRCESEAAFLYANRAQLERARGPERRPARFPGGHRQVPGRSDRRPP